MDCSTRELSPTFALVTGIPDLGLWPGKRRHVHAKSLALAHAPLRHTEFSLESPPSMRFKIALVVLSASALFACLGMRRMTMF